jgi:hypothetical protein
LSIQESLASPTADDLKKLRLMPQQRKCVIGFLDNFNAPVFDIELMQLRLEFQPEVLQNTGSLAKNKKYADTTVKQHTQVGNNLILLARDLSSIENCAA